MKQTTLTTSHIPGEQPRQYAAWLLYCESGSLEKTIRLWETIANTSDTEMIPVFGIPMGKPVGLATLKRWSSRYHWKQRMNLKNKEDLEEMREKFRWIKQNRTYKVALLFDRIANKLLRQLKQGMPVTVKDLYIAWKMFRVEEGLSIGIYEVQSPEQSVQPQTPEQIQFDKEIQDVVDQFYAKKRKGEMKQTNDD